MNNGMLCKKVLFSGIELISEFLGRTIRNYNQFLLSIVSYSFYLFGEFAEDLILTGKSEANKKAHSGARALSCPSRCQKLDKIFFAIFCAEICCNSFRQRYMATNIVFVCFFNIGKIYTGKIN